MFDVDWMTIGKTVLVVYVPAVIVILALNECLRLWMDLE